MSKSTDNLDALKAERLRVEALVADTRAEKAFIVRQSGVHLSRREWLRYDEEIEKYEAQLAELDARIAELKRA